MEEEDYYDDGGMNEDYCEAHYQYNCPICCGGEDPDQDTELENAIYEARGYIKQQTENEISNPTEALEYLQTAYLYAENSQNRKDWIFTIKEIEIPIQCRLQQINNLENELQVFIEYLNTASPNDQQKLFMKILENLHLIQNQERKNILINYYIENLNKNGYNHLWYKGNIYMAKNYLNENNYTDLMKILRQLKQQYLGDKVKNANKIIEIYAIEIQYCLKIKDEERLQDIHNNMKDIQTTMQDPKSLAIIKDIQGKFSMNDQNWKQAENETWESFLNYQKLGDPQGKQMLKYHVLCRILNRNETNIFLSQEAMAIQNDPEIQIMKKLALICETNDTQQFLQFYQEQQFKLFQDIFFSKFFKLLEETLFLSKIESLQKNYSVMKIQYLQKYLQRDEKTILDMIIHLIKTKRIFGRLDFINKTFVKEQTQQTNSNIQLLQQWLKQYKCYK